MKISYNKTKKYKINFIETLNEIYIHLYVIKYTIIKFFK